MEMLERTLSDIATTVPGAAAVLRDLKLNFCCDGQVSLAQALNSKGMDAQNVVHKLNELTKKEAQVDWSKEPPARLISHILERYHARHREQLPELIFLAGKVERVHGDKASCPHGLTELLRDVFHELDGHMMKEEQILFPMLGGGVYPNGPINVMQEEHKDHMQAIERIRALTDDITPPLEACSSWRALYLGLETFTDDLMQHITLENYFLFVPRRS